MTSVHAMATEHACTVPQLIFAFSLAVGMQVLTGTTSATHMAEDLRATTLELSDAERDALESIDG